MNLRSSTCAVAAAIFAIGALIQLAATAALADPPATESVALTSLDLSLAKQGYGKPAVDRTVDGHPLTLARKVFAHGFGTHSPGLLAVALNGQATRFTATVGVDDEVLTSKRGSAEFMVVGDRNRVLWRSGVCHPGDVPKSVDVDLTGVQRVILRVTDAGDGYEFDHSDWADATFTVKSGAHIAAATLPVTEPKIAMMPLPGDRNRIAKLRAGASKGVAGLPPMGWNSYDCFGDSVTEAEVLGNAQYIHDNLQPYGWDTIVVDYRWYDPGAHDNNANARAGATFSMDATGRLIPAPNRFPSAASGVGFKALADKVHAMGMHFGIHIMRGTPRQAVAANYPIDGSTFHAADAADTSDKCPWSADMFGIRGETPAGRAYYDSIIRLYASWGVDFIKMDDTSSPYHTSEIDDVHAAIAKCGRPIVYSLSPGETPIQEAAHVAGHANMWRVSGDFWDSWSALNHEFALANRWQHVGGPGHWPDADMLPIGHLSVGRRSVDRDRQTRFTHAEQVTLLSLWSLLPSPLMAGADFRETDAWTKALLTNPEVIAIDQDPAALPAVRIDKGDETEIWGKRLAGGDRAIGLFNRSDMDLEITLTPAMLSRLQPTDTRSPASWMLRDIWQRKPIGPLGEGYTVTVPAHGAVLLRATGQR